MDYQRPTSSSSSRVPHYRSRSPSTESDYSATGSYPASRPVSPAHPGRESPMSRDNHSSYPEQDRYRPVLPGVKDILGDRYHSEFALDARIRHLGIAQPIPTAPPCNDCCSRSRNQTQHHHDIRRVLRDPHSSSSSHRSPHETAHRLPEMDQRRSTSFSRRDVSPNSRAHSVHREFSSSIESESDDSYYSSSRTQESYRRPCSLQTRRPQPTYRLSYPTPELDRPQTNVDARYSPGHKWRPAYPSLAAVPYNIAHRTSPARSDGPSWLDYAEEVGRVNGVGPPMFTCMWEKEEGGVCKYTGKKQLCKRHVESVHLGLKPFVCPWYAECEKSFPQKTSLDIHIRGSHTGEKSIKCDHCDSRFSDPARRHKHVKSAHPDKVISKPRNKTVLDEIAHLLVKTS